VKMSFQARKLGLIRNGIRRRVVAVPVACIFVSVPNVPSLGHWTGLLVVEVVPETVVVVYWQG